MGSPGQRSPPPWASPAGTGPNLKECGTKTKSELSAPATGRTDQDPDGKRRAQGLRWGHLCVCTPEPHTPIPRACTMTCETEAAPAHPVLEDYAAVSDKTSA